MEAQSTQLHPPKQSRRFIITDIGVTIGMDIGIAGGVMAVASAAGNPAVIIFGPFATGLGALGLLAWLGGERLLLLSPQPDQNT